MRAKLAAVVIILVVGTFFSQTIREGNYLGSDFSMYMIHARNIVEGKNYTDTGYIYNPSRSTHSPRSYPPVFPLMLVPTYSILGMDIMIMKIELIVIFMVFLSVAFSLFRSQLQPWYAVAIVALIGFSPYFWSFKDNILSDIPFLLFVFTWLLFITLVHVNKCVDRYDVFRAFLAGLLMYLAFGTRTVGIVLIPSLILFDVITVRRLTLFSGIAIASCFVFMISQDYLIDDVRSYSDQFILTLDIVKRNIKAYSAGFALIWYGSLGWGNSLMLFIAASCLALIGFVDRVTRNVTILETFSFMYVGTIICWPVMQGMRFMIPILPLYLFYVYCGIVVVGRRSGSTSGKALHLIIVLPIIVSYAETYAKANFRPLSEGFNRGEVVELQTFVVESTDSDDVFVLNMPRMLALLGRRKSSTFNIDLSDAEQWKYLCGISVRYIIDKKNSKRESDYLDKFLDRYKDRFQKVFENESFKISRIRNGVCSQGQTAR